MRKLIIPACLALCSIGWISGCGASRPTHTITKVDTSAHSRGMPSQKWTVSDTHPGQPMTPSQQSPSIPIRKNTPIGKEDQITILNMTSKEVPPSHAVNAAPPAMVSRQPSAIGQASSGEPLAPMPLISTPGGNGYADGPIIINSNGPIDSGPLPQLPALVSSPALPPAPAPAPAPVVKSAPVPIATPAPEPLPKVVVMEDAPKVKTPVVLESVPAKPAPVVVEPSKSLTGQVQEWRKTWRLRYAEVDQVDPHGGCVLLEGSPELAKLRDGQRVRVRGTLIPAEDRAGNARYRVESIEILD
jgi:hypothetical protein